MYGEKSDSHYFLQDLRKWLYTRGYTSTNLDLCQYYKVTAGHYVIVYVCIEGFLVVPSHSNMFNERFLALSNKYDIKPLGAPGK